MYRMQPVFAAQAKKFLRIFYFIIFLLHTALGRGSLVETCWLEKQKRNIKFAGIA